MFSASTEDAAAAAGREERVASRLASKAPLPPSRVSSVLLVEQLEEKIWYPRSSAVVVD